MYNVYLENRRVAFCTQPELPSQTDDAEVICENGHLMLESIVDSLISGKLASDVFIVDENAEKLFAEFCRFFREINAGGGVVAKGGSYLMIFRRGLWDLPKGKQEDGESIEDCAIREVGEETGIDNVKIGSRICITHHIYQLDGVFCLKHTHWFSMLYNGCKSPSPQVEEEITKAEWMSMDEMAVNASNSYRSIREVISSL